MSSDVDPGVLLVSEERRGAAEGAVRVVVSLADGAADRSA